MSKLYVGLAFADSMVPVDCCCCRQELTAQQVRNLLTEPHRLTIPRPQVVNCCNPSHAPTLSALVQRYGIDLYTSLAGRPHVVNAEYGDYILVMSVRGLPRLTDRHEYTSEEVVGATFAFGLWEVCHPKAKLQL